METERVRRRRTPLAAAALLGLVLAQAGAPAEGDAPAQLARRLLEATGVRGGLIVHLGCGAGELTAALRASDSLIVQGLDTSAQKVREARQHIAGRGPYGEVTAREFDGRRLPFADSMVNLLVVDDAFAVPRDEMLRVLCPKGTLCAREGDKWKTEVKPWPAGMDEWTHYHHDPQGTMVGKDKLVGPPRRIQWMGDPKWLRNHDFMSSMNAMVSAGGRIFYIIDEGLRAHIWLPARWMLIARDGFNGTVLWKRPLKDWHPANWPLKSGPGYLPRRLVAVGGRVFATLGLNEPLTALDAATGQTIRVYEETKATEEIVCDDGVLFLHVDPNRQPVGYRAKSATYGEIGHANTGWGWTKDKPERRVMAVDAASGTTLWQHTAKVAPLSLTVGEKRVFFYDGDNLVALDRKTGQPAWTSEGQARVTIRPATGAAPRVILSQGVLVLCCGTQVVGFAAEDGKLLWQGKIPPTGHHCPSDLFVINGLIWSAHTGTAQQKGTHFVALDLRTGATVKDLVAENLPAFPMHARCYPSRATERHIMLAGIGTEFYQPGDSKLEIHNYVRGSCIYGVMPCNGLLYKPPDSCACYYMSKLEYFCALAPAAKAPAAPAPEAERFEKGPAYSEIRNPRSAIRNSDEWPMYRHDPFRSGSCATAVPDELKTTWEVKLGGKLTQAVVAGGKAFVASVDAQTLYALDARTGKELWKHVAGGRIDSAPTIHEGRVLFGSADGRVTCLRADDGALAWRYLVAPEDRQIISCQRPESIWPVSGSVLVQGGTVYALAGRNVFFDGGLRLARLDAATGRKISETVLDENDPQTGKNLQTLIVGKSMPVANADLLSCDGKYLYMAAQRFDLEGKRTQVEPISSRAGRATGDGVHLFCSTGFLDDLWFHRSYWTLGERFPEGWSEYSQAQRVQPSGRIMALDETRAYGFRADGLGNTLLPTPTYRLYAADRAARGDEKPEPAAKKGAGRKAKGGKGGDDNIAGGHKVYWQIQSPPLLVNAMAAAGKRLFVAGPPDVADEAKMLGFLPGADDESNRQLAAQDEAWRGKRGGLLWVIATEDGRKVAECRLDSLPVFDGLAAAGGRVYIATQDGRVLCLGGDK